MIWIPINVTVLLTIPGSYFARRRICEMPIGLRHPHYRSGIIYFNLIIAHVYIDFLQFKR